MHVFMRTYLCLYLSAVQLNVVATGTLITAGLRLTNVSSRLMQVCTYDHTCMYPVCMHIYTYAHITHILLYTYIIYIHTVTYIHIRAHVCVLMYTYIHIHICECMYIIHTHMHICTYTYTYICAYTRASQILYNHSSGHAYCINTHVYIHTYIHIHTHMHMHICIHTHMCIYAHIPNII